LRSRRFPNPEKSGNPARTSAQSLSVALSQYRSNAFVSNPFITQGLPPTGDAHKYGFVDRF